MSYNNLSRHWPALAERDGGWICHYCHIPVSSDGPHWPNTDHKIPRGEGGNDDLSNLVLACYRCNQIKHLKSYEWMMEHGVKYVLAERETEAKRASCVGSELDWHASIPNSILHNPNIPPGPKMLWVMLSSYTSADSPVAFPSHPTLAWGMVCSRISVMRYQKWLQEHGYLDIESRPNNSNLYLLKNPDEGKKWVRREGTSLYVAASHKDQNRRNIKIEAPIIERHKVVPLKENQKEGEPPPSLLSSNFIRAWEEAYRIVNNKTWDITESTKKKVEKWFRENPDTQVANLIRTAIDAWTMDISADEKHFYFTKRCRYSILSFLDQYDRLVDELGHNRPGHKWDREVLDVLDRVVSAVCQGS